MAHLARLADLRSRATRPRRTVPVLLDGTLREQIEAVEDELDRLADAPAKYDRRLADKPPERALQEDLDRLRAEAETSTLYVVLEAMQRTAYRALVAEHQSTEDGRQKLDPAFYPALIKACIVGYREQPTADAPVLTDWPDEGYVAWLVDEFVSPGQFDKLTVAATYLSSGDDAVPLPRKRSETETSDAG